MKMKVLCDTAIAALTLMSGVIVAQSIQPGYALMATRSAPASQLVCGQYITDEDWNISYNEILGLTSFEEGYKNFNAEEVKSLSSIIDSVSAENAQFYRQETDRLEVKSLKFGGGSKAGKLVLTLTKDIDAIGFYADAYQNTNDQNNKTLKVNNIETHVLGSSYVYDLSDVNQKFFIEFSSSTHEITIESSLASSNRFHIYSIGFYSKNNFPDADLTPVDPPVSNTVTFTPSDFSGQGTTSTGSSMSATKNGVTISTNKGFGTTEIRIYQGGSFSISSTTAITALSFTFSGGKTGGLYTSYTGLNTTTWEQASLASQARFSQIVVTLSA